MSHHPGRERWPGGPARSSGGTRRKWPRRASYPPESSCQSSAPRGKGVTTSPWRLSRGRSSPISWATSWLPRERGGVRTSWVPKGSWNSKAGLNLSPFTPRSCRHFATFMLTFAATSTPALASACRSKASALMATATASPQMRAGLGGIVEPHRVFGAHEDHPAEDLFVKSFACL
jgi:hypothetical protein